MHGDNYPEIQPTRNDGPATPPPILPPEEETAYDGPRSGSPRAASVLPERRQPPSYVRWIGGCLIVFVLVALLCGGGIAVVGAITLSSTPATATVDKSFSVSGVPTLVIHYNAASVHVLTGSAGQVSLHATKQVRALTRDQAQRTLDGVTVTATQTGNVLTIEVNTGPIVEFNPFSNRQVDVTLTTPSNTNVSVTGNAGSLDATGLTGKVTAQVNAGSVTMDTMTLADGSSLRTNAGSLTLDGAMQQGASLTVTVNAGSVDLTLPKDTSAHVNASASAGSVDVTGWNLYKVESGAHQTVIGDLNPNPTGSIFIRVSAGSATLTAA